MSTRCIVEFSTFDKGKKISYVRLYKHTDGYPDGKYGMISLLKKFMTEGTDSHLNGDILILPVDFIIWLKNEWYGSNYCVGICCQCGCDEDYGAAYKWYVECHSEGKIIIKGFYNYGDKEKVAEKVLRFIPN